MTQTNNANNIILITQRKPENPLPGFEELDYLVFPACNSNLIIPYVGGKYQLGFEYNSPEAKSWEKLLGVKFDTPEGQAFLDNYTIDLNHDSTIITQTPKGRFDLHLIKVHNGFGVIKLDDAEVGPSDPYIFELKDVEKEQDKHYTKVRVKNEAIAELEKLDQSSKQKLILIAKYIFEINSGINTDVIAYNRLDAYISQSDQNAAYFLRALKVDSNYMDTVVTTKEAMSRNIIRLSGKHYINYATGNILGKTFEEVVEHLNDPTNIQELGTGLKGDDPTSIKMQLKNSAV